jgi:hypothetical protein
MSAVPCRVGLEPREEGLEVGRLVRGLAVGALTVVALREGPAILAGASVVRTRADGPGEEGRAERQ